VCNLGHLLLHATLISPQTGAKTSIYLTPLRPNRSSLGSSAGSGNDGPMRLHSGVAGAVVALSLLLSASSALGASTSSGSSGKAISAARSVAQSTTAGATNPTVGALFFPSAGGLGPALGLPHTCTGSVVHSATHDLVLTAAHCLLTPGSAFQFAPAYTNGAMPYGLWTVTKVFVNAAWNSSHDEQHDYAFLRVAPRTVGGVSRHIEDVTGANTLGLAPATGTTVTITGYRLGSNDSQFGCTSTTYVLGPYPAFDCDGFVDGTSGSPWLVGTGGSATVVGVIGGLEQGGCTATTSYTSPFGADTMHDFARAQTQVRSDSVSPLIGGDC